MGLGLTMEGLVDLSDNPVKQLRVDTLGQRVLGKACLEGNENKLMLRCFNTRYINFLGDSAISQLLHDINNS